MKSKSERVNFFFLHAEQKLMLKQAYLVRDKYVWKARILFMNRNFRTQLVFGSDLRCPCIHRRWSAHIYPSTCYENSAADNLCTFLAPPKFQLTKVDSKFQTGKLQTFAFAKQNGRKIASIFISL